jgi:hypothetical protein
MTLRMWRPDGWKLDDWIDVLLAAGAACLMLGLGVLLASIGFAGFHVGFR